MRTWVVMLAVLAAPAMAEGAPVLDGKAALSGKAGEALAGVIATKEQVRSIIVAAISDGLSPQEADFFKEAAAGGAVDAAASGKTVRVGPLTGEALATAKLVAAPPNLNELYKTHGEPMLQMVEMSRWGDAGKNRVTGFMAQALCGVGEEPGGHRLQGVAGGVSGGSERNGHDRGSGGEDRSQGVAEVGDGTAVRQVQGGRARAAAAVPV